MTGLRKDHPHPCQLAVGVHGEGGRNLKWRSGVDAPCPRSEVLLGKVTGTVPSIAAAVAPTQTEAVRCSVKRRVPGVLVGFLDVDLGAGLTTDVVGITIIVVARGFMRVLAHGDEVQSRIAPTACSGKVCGVPEGLTKEVEPQVLGAIEDAGGASICKVGPAVHEGHYSTAFDLHLLPPGRNDGNPAIASHVDRPRASGGLRGGHQGVHSRRGSHMIRTTSRPRDHLVPTPSPSGIHERSSSALKVAPMVGPISKVSAARGHAAPHLASLPAQLHGSELRRHVWVVYLANDQTALG
mmetsp:Transcript_70992/g.144197  ORF Transcript_70992/g.144197 Transcript_70992/m.144197 type:complete len:296 (-) Transcript_70992:47-934(-)